VRLIDLYHQDLQDQTTTEARQYCRRYWYRAIGLTIMERWSFSAIAVPKRGTHGVRTERFTGFWNAVPDDELEELFYTLKPYFSLAQHKHCDLDE
jgi:hypothetical protein